METKLPMRANRLEALGDGIFAIAMTILVLELKLPDIKGNSFHDFIEGFHENGIELMCYVISFIVLGIMWFGHSMMFQFIGRSNRYFIFLGVLFYMFICLIPFSTRFLAQNFLSWQNISFYALNLSLCNIAIYAQWSYGIKRVSLLERTITNEVKKHSRFLFLISPAVYAIAIIFSFCLPLISIFIFILTPIVYLLPDKIDDYLP